MKITHDFTTNNSQDRLPFIEEAGLHLMKVVAVSTKELEEKAKFGLILHTLDETQATFVSIYLKTNEGKSNGFATFTMNALLEANNKPKFDTNVEFDTDIFKGLLAPVEIVEGVWNGKVTYNAEVISINSVPWKVEKDGQTDEYATKQEFFKNELAKNGTTVEQVEDTLTDLEGL